MQDHNHESPIASRLSTAEAARYLGYSQYTLRRARVDGLLAGVQAPAYHKQASRNARVFYERAELDRWLAQGREQHCTAQTQVA